MPLVFVRVETNPGGNRKVIGGISSIAVIVQDLCLNNFRTGQDEYVVDFLPIVPALEGAIGPCLHVRMQHAEGIDQRNGIRIWAMVFGFKCNLAFQIQDGGVVLIGIEIADHYDRV